MSTQPRSARLARRGVPFAWRSVAHQRRRSAVAAAGVAFSILVVFLQLGFYRAVVRTATAIPSHLDADLVLVSPRFVHLSEADEIDRARLFQALAVPEVASARPLYLRYARWRDPVSGERCKLFALGFPLDSGSPLRVDGIVEQLPALAASDTLLLDSITQRDCGPLDAAGRVELREQAARVVGRYELGVGFLGDGSLLLSDDGFSRYFAGQSLDRVQLGLVRLKPGAQLHAAAEHLRRVLPPDLRVLALSELEALQIRHWVENTAVGNIFGLGALAGFAVGLVVLHQVLATDIRNQLPLFSTLKAMGYGDRRLRRLVLEQAGILVGLAFGPAVALAALIFALVQALTLLPIELTPGLLAGVAGLTLAMSAGAALLSERRLRRADPAELY